jgi:hypothetical protein
MNFSITKNTHQLPYKKGLEWVVISCKHFTSVIRYWCRKSMSSDCQLTLDVEHLIKLSCIICYCLKLWKNMNYVLLENNWTKLNILYVLSRVTFNVIQVHNLTFRTICHNIIWPLVNWHWKISLGFSVLFDLFHFKNYEQN